MPLPRLQRLLSEDSDYSELSFNHYEVLKVIRMDIYRTLDRAHEEYNFNHRRYERLTFHEFFDYINDLIRLDIIDIKSLRFGCVGVKKLINM